MIKAKKLAFVYALCFMFYVLLALPAVAQEDTGGLVREKVREQVENIIRKPRAAVGELTEITDTTLEIKNRNGNLEMAATSEGTSYVRVAGGRRAEIKFEDLALGDFTVAMGHRNGNEVLEAQRVITYDNSPLVKKGAVYGVVQGNTSGEITIRHPQTGEVASVLTTSNTQITKKGESGFDEVEASEIEVGDRLIAAGAPDKTGAIEAGRIHVIPAQ